MALRGAGTRLRSSTSPSRLAPQAAAAASEEAVPSASRPSSNVLLRRKAAGRPQPPRSVVQAVDDSETMTPMLASTGNARVSQATEKRAKVAATCRRRLGKYTPRASTGEKSYVEGRAVEPGCARRYSILMAAFYQFVNSLRLPTDTPQQVDVARLEYLDHPFFDGAAKDEATARVAAWMDANPAYSRCVSRSLPGTQRALQGFRKMAPAMTRSSLPRNQMCRIAPEVLTAGPEEVAALTAIFLLMMFLCYFRPGAALTRRGTNVVPPVGQHRFPAVNMFPSGRGQTSKTGLLDVSILLDSPYAQWLNPLIPALAQHQEDRLLFDFEYSRAKMVFEDAQTRLGLRERFVLHQARHGGPSHDRAMGLRTLAEIKTRGTWTSDASLKRDEAHARLQQVEARLEPATQIAARAAPSALQKLLPSALARLLQRRLRQGGAPLRPSSTSSQAPVASRKRLRTKGACPRPGTPTITAPTTSAPTATCDASEGACDRAVWQASGSVCPAQAGLGRAKRMGGVLAL